MKIETTLWVHFIYNSLERLKIKLKECIVTDMEHWSFSTTVTGRNHFKIQFQIVKPN